MPNGRKTDMSTESPPPITPLQILLVDDHHDTIKALDLLLTRDGHHVRTAEDSAVALASARGERFDVLLTDIGMPDGDGGCDLLSEIRALYPVWAIALTAYGMPDDFKRIMASGFDQFLLKPVELADVRAALAVVAPLIRDEQIGLLAALA
jgi:CheY-like chemotaxis protein